MAARKISIFGAGGAIGRQVAAALLARGDTVTALQHRRPAPQGCRIVEGSVSDFETVNRAIGDSEIVLQLATTKEDRAQFLDIAVRGTFNILDALRRRGGCEQFVLAGGDCALGIWHYPQPEPLTERSPLRAYPGYYALSKVLEETLVEQYRVQYGLPVTVLRMGWVHQPRSLLLHFLAGNVRGQLRKNIFAAAMPPALKKRAEGDGPAFVFAAVNRETGRSIRRTTVSFRDVVQAWTLAIGNPLARNQVFNVVHPAWDYDEAAALISKRLDLPVEHLPLDAYSWEMDTSKIRNLLGWRPADDIFGMLDQALADGETW